MKEVMKDPQHVYVMMKKTIERGLLIIGSLYVQESETKGQERETKDLSPRER